MSGLFIAVLNMSFTASFVALAVLLLRLPLKKAPQVFSYALWAVVFFKLICPFTIEAPVSVNPIYPQAIPPDIVYAPAPAIHSGVAVLNRAVNGIMDSTLPPALPEQSVNPVQIILEAGAYIWLAGILILLIYAMADYIRIRRRLSWAVLVEGNIFETDRIKTPFVLGLIRPRIYLPTGLSAGERGYIVKHEQTHIRRLDYLVKPLAYLIAVLHWFNPLAWLSYSLMVKDMELSADESVIRNAAADIRGDYSRSLYALSARNSGLLSPLAFGETRVKARIRNVLNYKKPAFWISAAAVVLLIAAVIILAVSAHGPVSAVVDPDDPDTLYGSYIFDKQLYMNPLSSFIAFDGLKEYYTLSEKTLVITAADGTRHYIAVTMEEGAPLDRAKFGDMFMDGWEGPDIAKYRDCYEYRLCESNGWPGYSLYLMDQEIWLARMLKGRLWSIYRIKKYSGSLPPPAYNADPALYEWSGTISMPIPAPPGAETFFQSGGDGAVDCRGCSKQDLDQYIQLLQDEGWTLLPQEPESMVYMLIQGNDMVYLADQTDAEEDYKSIQVSYAPGYRGPAESGRRTIEEAAAMLQGHLDSLETSDIYGYGKKIYFAREIDLSDAYEKMGLQGFEVNGSEGYIGRFVIGRSGAILNLGFAVEVCTADIDGDGEMELITLGAWGSGIYRVDVRAYRYNAEDNAYDLAYSNWWIPRNVSEDDCWNMSLVKIDDSTVHLYGADLEAGRFVPREDYGKLLVKGEKLVPTTTDIPFDEWGM